MYDWPGLSFGVRVCVSISQISKLKNYKVDSIC